MSAKKIAKAVMTVTVFSVFTRLLSFIFKIYLSREMGAEVVGLYQMCISMFYLFSAIGASGIPTVLSRKIAEVRAVDEKNTGNDLFTSAIFLGVLISAVTLGTLLIFKDGLKLIIKNEKAIPLFLIMIPALVSTCIYSIIRGLFWGKKQFLYFSITETVEEVLRIFFSVLFVSGLISGISGAYGIALAFTVSDIVVGILLTIMFFAKGGRITKLKNVKDIFKPALPITTMRIFGSLITTVVALLLPARLIAAGLNPEEATAAYGRIAGMANPLIMAPNAIISSVAVVLIPEMSENNIKSNFSVLNNHINSSISFALIICGLFLIPFISLGEEITVLLFNDAISGQYLSYAALLMIPMAVGQIITSAMNSLGLEKESFYNYLISTVFILLIIYFLPKYIGIYAVAIASATSLTISAVGNYLVIRKKTHLPCDFVKPLILVSVFLVPCCYMTNNLNGILGKFMGQFSILLAVAGGLAMYFVLALVSDLIDVKMLTKRKKRKPLKNVA